METDTENHLPLMAVSSELTTVAFYEGRIIDRKTFLFHVALVRRELFKNKYCINLCENRYHFLVVFSACIANGQISLLPSSRATREIERLQDLYNDNYIIDDRSTTEICQKDVYQEYVAEDELTIKPDQVVAVVFTSGSTGTPKANPKTWRQLYKSALLVKNRFKINKFQQHALVATVPPQHMFGFETTIVYPLVLGVAIHCGRPFYPLDIKTALAEIASPRILITTPLHLKTCASETNGWPDIDFIISATAEMSIDVAMQAEKTLKTRVFEIYGCSEAGAIATRQTSIDKGWYLLTSYKITISDDITFLQAPGYKEKIIIPDKVEVNDSYFKLVGRHNDMLNIGGKRGSLSDLTKKIKNIEGVKDAVFIKPDEINGKRTRLAAFVVVSDTDIKKIRQEFSEYVDSVFIPRPLIIVDQLPYNESGKLPRARLLELLDMHLKKYDYQDIA